MKNVLMFCLLMTCAVQAQVMVRGKGNDWMLITSDPPNCSMNVTTAMSTTTAAIYQAPCHWEAITYIRWFPTEDAAFAWANDTQSLVSGLYHVDHETAVTSIDYQVSVKQPDKTEHRKKYSRAK